MADAGSINTLIRQLDTLAMHEVDPPVHGVTLLVPEEDLERASELIDVPADPE